MKYLDKKIRGRIKFDPPTVQAREAKPRDMNHRSLIKLAEIALNVRQGPSIEEEATAAQYRNHGGSRLSNGRSSLSPRRISVNKRGSAVHISQDFDGQMLTTNAYDENDLAQPSLEDSIMSLKPLTGFKHETHLNVS